MALPWLCGVRPAQADARHLGQFPIDRLVIVELAADHVGVEAAAADVLADPVDQQHVGPGKRQPRHPLPGQEQQLLFAGLEIGRCHGFDQGGLVVGVFHDRQAGEDAAAAEALRPPRCG